MCHVAQLGGEVGEFVRVQLEGFERGQVFDVLRHHLDAIVTQVQLDEVRECEYIRGDIDQFHISEIESASLLGLSDHLPYIPIRIHYFGSSIISSFHLF